jgi:hypothetical protein
MSGSPTPTLHRSRYARRVFAVLVASLCVQVASASAASAAPVVPFVNCVLNNSNGTTTVVVGYRNPNPTAVNVPLSFNNQASPVNPPTGFAPGTNNTAFTATVTGTNYAYWLLNSDGSNYYFAFANTASTPKCAASSIPVTGSNAAGGVAGVGGLMGLTVVVKRSLRRGREPRIRGTFAAPATA